MILGARTAILDSDVLIEIMREGLEKRLSVLFSKIYVPMDVKGEQIKQRRRRRLARLFRSGVFHKCSASDQTNVFLLRQQKLGKGESEAIIQAQEMNIEVFLTNDKRAKRIAARYNLGVLSYQDILKYLERIGM